MTVKEENLKIIDLEKASTSDRKREVILTVKDLKTYYPIFGGIFKRVIAEVKAVDGVSFNLYKQETLGLVGESGCGKTTIGNTILNLVPNNDGEIYFEDRRIDHERMQGIFESIFQKYGTFLRYAISNIYQKNVAKIEDSNGSTDVVDTIKRLAMKNIKVSELQAKFTEISEISNVKLKIDFPESITKEQLIDELNKICKEKNLILIRS